MTIDRDLLSRMATLRSPYFNATFPEDSYDPVGNLLHYQYEDPMGKVECRYVYDTLDQLRSEDEHTYLCDSLQNRLEKDDTAHQVNNLCQITDDGVTQYSYDPDGNLIYDGTWHYTYDSQDRLISLEKNNLRLEYTYDPFHRRLSKKVFVDSRQTHYERFLRDGDHEIGLVNEKGLITQLRVLGEGLGAEIGAAVLYELNGKTYVPLHDHRGNVVTVIDIISNQPVETYRYTAFGEEQIISHLSPWRFSSKRVEPERGLLFFGRRYYYPTLGRWITQDPQGFDDGPNLYAYLSHSPMADIDLYGLEAFSSYYDFFIGSRMDPFAGPKYFLKNWCGDPLHEYSYFENSFSNKSCLMNLRENFSIGKRSPYDYPDPSIGAYCFGNGVDNFKDGWKKGAKTIAEISGYNVTGIYNATHSKPVDFYEAAANLLFNAKTPPVWKYVEEIKNFCERDKSGAPMFMSVHSQATGQLRNALRICPEDQRKRVIVAAFCPSAYIDPKLCLHVTHIVCPDDIIPKLDVFHKNKYPETIVYVPRRPGDSIVECHSFLNPMYLPYLIDEINNYKKILKKYEH